MPKHFGVGRRFEGVMLIFIPKEMFLIFARFSLEGEHDKAKAKAGRVRQ